MKKMLSVIMVGILIFSLTGCGGNNADSGKDSAAANENTVSQETAGAKENASLPAPENEADESGQSELESSMAEQDTAKPESSATTGSETEPDAADGSNALVVYFSWSGNTENVANAIAEQTGADVFEIVPEETYTSDYNVLLDIASEEKESGARPAIAGSIEDISQYEFIYVGFPNWIAYHNMAIIFHSILKLKMM